MTLESMKHTPDESYTQDQIKALIEPLREALGLKDGELYKLRRGLFEHVELRDDDNGLRRIRIMPEAYQAAYDTAKRCRAAMRGYRPDPALVISAWVMHTAQREDAGAIAQAYLRQLFSPED